MEILHNIPLAPYTTFKIGGLANYFCVAQNEFELAEALQFAEEKELSVFILGGGSNILVSDEGYNGLVIKVIHKGVEILNNDDNNSIWLKVSSSEVWDDIVKLSVKNNWWGIENLSHIPGLTGAIAVQNVGAYGQEASNVIENVTVFNKKTKIIEILKNTECGFSYRRSIFNSTHKGVYVILDITFKLQKNGKPNIGYRDLHIRFEHKHPSIEEVRQAVIEIRDKKFPFPKEAKNGNAGSFFKNPIISQKEYESLQSKIEKEFGLVVSEDLQKKKFVDNEDIKIPAAFLIDICKLKDLNFGGAAINNTQPLVIVNKTGTATATDVIHLAYEVKETVFNKTGIELAFEPEFIGF